MQTENPNIYTNTKQLQTKPTLTGNVNSTTGRRKQPCMYTKHKITCIHKKKKKKKKEKKKNTHTHLHTKKNTYANEKKQQHMHTKTNMHTKNKHTYMQRTHQPIYETKNQPACETHKTPADNNKKIIITCIRKQTLIRRHNTQK